MHLFHCESTGSDGGLVLIHHNSTRIPPLVKAGVVPSLAKKKLDNLPGFWYNVDEEKQIGYMRVYVHRLAGLQCSLTPNSQGAQEVFRDADAGDRQGAQRRPGCRAQSEFSCVSR